MREGEEMRLGVRVERDRLGELVLAERLKVALDLLGVRVGVREVLLGPAKAGWTTRQAVARTARPNAMALLP